MQFKLFPNLKSISFWIQIALCFCSPAFLPACSYVGFLGPLTACSLWITILSWSLFPLSLFKSAADAVDKTLSPWGSGSGSFFQVACSGKQFHGKSCRRSSGFCLLVGAHRSHSPAALRPCLSFRSRKSLRNGRTAQKTLVCRRPFSPLVMVWLSLHFNRLKFFVSDC